MSHDQIAIVLRTLWHRRDLHTHTWIKHLEVEMAVPSRGKGSSVSRRALGILMSDIQDPPEWSPYICDLLSIILDRFAQPTSPGICTMISVWGEGGCVLQ